MGVQGVVQCEDAGTHAGPAAEAAEDAEPADVAESRPPTEEPHSPSPTASKENEGNAACGNSTAGAQAIVDRVQYGCSGVAGMGPAADAEPARSSMSSAKDAALSPSHFLVKECC